ncbi:MAG: methyltransferase domain-containing protein [Anaerolineae bacterium]
MRILDVGCGQAKTPGAIGLDNNPFTEADVLVDVDHQPWPFRDNSFERVVCRHIVEHVVDMIAFFEEVHRVSKAGAVVEIVTPHFSNRYSFTDPTHLRHLAWRSFDYFTGESVQPTLTFWDRAFQIRHPIPGFYTQARFRRRRALIDFGRPFRLLGLQWLANRWPDFYEMYLTFLLPARDLYVTLEVLK